MIRDPLPLLTPIQQGFSRILENPSHLPLHNVPKVPQHTQEQKAFHSHRGLAYALLLGLATLDDDNP